MQVQKYGFAKEYNKGVVPVVRMVQRLAALPLLRIGDIDSGVNYAASTINNVNDELVVGKMTQLSNYAKKTWTDAAAKFPSSLWSRFDVDGNVVSVLISLIINILNRTQDLQSSGRLAFCLEFHFDSRSSKHLQVYRYHKT